MQTPFRALPYVLLCLMAATSAQAQGGPGNRMKVVPADKPSYLGGFFNCSGSGMVINNVTATASNGRVATQPATGNHCGNPNQPRLNLVYIPNPGFRGEDIVQIYRGGARMEQRLLVR